MIYHIFMNNSINIMHSILEPTYKPLNNTSLHQSSKHRKVASGDCLQQLHLPLHLHTGLCITLEYVVCTRRWYRNLRVPFKVRSFFWVLLQNKLLTKEVLAMRGMNVGVGFHLTINNAMNRQTIYSYCVLMLLHFGLFSSLPLICLISCTTSLNMCKLCGRIETHSQQRNRLFGIGLGSRMLGVAEREKHEIILQ